MTRILLFACFLAGSASIFAQESKLSGSGVVTSIDSQGRELIVGQEIYIVPKEVNLNGVRVPRSRIVELISLGDEVWVDTENGRFVKEIHARLQ